MKLLRNRTMKSFLSTFLILGMAGVFPVIFSGCATEAKGGTLAGAGIGGLALAAAGSSPQARLLLGATGALAGGAIGNQLMDKPAAEAKYKKDVQLAADQAKASEYAKAEAQKDIEEKRLYEQWKREKGMVPAATPAATPAMPAAK